MFLLNGFKDNFQIFFNRELMILSDKKAKIIDKENYSLSILHDSPNFHIIII